MYINFIRKIGNGFLTGIGFGLTLLLIGISYASLSGLNATSGETLTAEKWNNLVSEVDVVAAKYNMTTSQSLPNGTITKINFNNKIYDSHNAVTTGSNWIFTAPKDGLYRVTTSLVVGPYTWTDPNSSFWGHLYKNGVLVERFTGTYLYTTVSTTGQINGSAILNLNAGETITVGGEIWRGVGGTLPNVSYANRVSIERIGNLVN